VDLETALGYGSLDVCVGLQVVELDQDIGVGQRCVTGEFAPVALHFVHILPGGLHVFKPVFDAVEPGQTLWIH